MTNETIKMNVPRGSFMEVNGINLHIMRAGNPDGEPVILLHGFPESWLGWQHQITPLAEASYNVIVPDQRGYNLSDKPDGVEAYRMENLVADVIGLADALGYDKVRLVGHDWGAVVAWYTAIWHPERLSQLVIMNVPHPKVFTKYLRNNIGQMLKSWYIGMFQIPALPEQMLKLTNYSQFEQIMRDDAKLTDSELRRHRATWEQPGAITAMINWYRAIARHSPQLDDDRVHVPTLMLWGMQDFALSHELAEPSIEMADEGRLFFFKDIGHFVQHANKERVNELLLKFFAHGLSLGEGNSDDSPATP